MSEHRVVASVIDGFTHISPRQISMVVAVKCETCGTGQYEQVVWETPAPPFSIAGIYEMTLKEAQAHHPEEEPPWGPKIAV